MIPHPNYSYDQMDEFAVINWSEVAREAFAEQIAKMEQLRSITSKSKATDKDIEVLAKKLKASIRKRHEENR